MIRGIIVIVLGCGALQNRAEAIEANGEWMILSPRRGEGITLLERRSGEVRLEVPAGRIGMTTIPLGKLFAPEVGEGIYAIRGEVSVAGVGGTGYLEMWSHFPGGGAYFSRTLAQVGPLQGLSGTQPWRGFLLPFDRGTVKERPSSIDLNLVLPVGGIVSLRKVRLVNFNSQLDLAEIMSAPLIVEDEPVSTAWWTDVQAGWVGGLGGECYRRDERAPCPPGKAKSCHTPVLGAPLLLWPRWPRAGFHLAGSRGL